MEVTPRHWMKQKEERDQDSCMTQVLENLVLCSIMCRDNFLGVKVGVIQGGSCVFCPVLHIASRQAGHDRLTTYGRTAGTLT